MENVISLLEGEVVKFKLNIERHKKHKLKHIAQYYEELKLEYEKAIEVLKISSNVPVMRSGCNCPISKTDTVFICEKCSPANYGC